MAFVCGDKNLGSPGGGRRFYDPLLEKPTDLRTYKAPVRLRMTSRFRRNRSTVLGKILEKGWPGNVSRGHSTYRQGVLSSIEGEANLRVLPKEVVPQDDICTEIWEKAKFLSVLSISIGEGDDAMSLCFSGEACRSHVDVTGRWEHLPSVSLSNV